MAIVGDEMADAAALVAKALAGLPALGWPVHDFGVPTEPVAPPCVLLGIPYATEQLGTLGCPEWAWEIRILCIGADTFGSSLPTIAGAAHKALWAAGIRSTSAPRTYNPDNRPAGLPALEITAS